jgi:NhaP-type Na+/H+ or K+/H+ antiporter
LSESEIYLALATIAVFGIGGQWIGRRFGFPSLLLLLPLGLLAGDVLGLVQPEALLGDLLFPAVELLVALLLFQSGLQLRFADLPADARSPVIRLVTVGATITFLGASLAVLTITDLDVGLAFLLGAIVVVSGPTVVGPLLRSLRPRAPLASVLNYEGTILDPLGATLGVVVLTVVMAAGVDDVHPVLYFLGRLGVGVAIGLAAAAVMVFVMSRFWLTYSMEAAVALMFAVVAFVLAEGLLSDSGLFAALTLGVALANQRRVSLRSASAFGETLEVLIIATLFILLGALVTVDALRQYAWEIVLLVAALVIIVRPVTVAVSLLGTRLGWRERALIGSVDPRGIVAASTAAAFTGSLAAGGFESDFLLPMAFGVILGTGIIYGLGAKPVAQALGVVRPTPRGVALIGYQPWVADLASRLQDLSASVLVMTARSPEEAQALEHDVGVPTLSLADTQANMREAVDRADIGQAAICAPSSVTVNLVDVLLIETMGRRKVLRLPDGRRTDALGGRVLADRSAHPFGPGVTLQDIEGRVDAGATVQVLEASPSADDLLLAAVSPDGAVNLQPGSVTPGQDDSVIALVSADATTPR